MTFKASSENLVNKGFVDIKWNGPVLANNVGKAVGDGKHLPMHSLT